MAKKIPAKEWPGALGEPIVAPFVFPAVGQKLDATPYWLVETLKKLFILFEHYKVEKNDWQTLVYVMARDLVPGFEVVYDDPLAAKIGLPVKGGVKANRAGSGIRPELEFDRLLALVAAMKAIFKVEKDADCARHIYEHFWPKPDGRLPRDFAEKSIKTIGRRISEARRRVEGPMRRSKAV